MLEAIRKHISGIVVKIFLGILILSFAVWGIGDTVRSLSTVSEVAKIGSIEISPERLNNEMQRELNRFRRSMGNQIDMEQARSLGLVDMTLGSLINNALFSLGAESLDVTISNAVVTEEIKKNPEFNGPLGQFDRYTFQQVLRNNGYSESAFIERVRENMKRGQYLESTASGGVAPVIMAEVLYRHRQEKRVAETIFFADEAMTSIGEPSQGELEKFHTDNAANFTAPEYRALTFIVMTSAELAKEIAVSEDDIKESYKNRKDEFNTPEQRQLLQIVVSDKALADKAHEKLSQGEDFAKVAKDVADLDPETLDIGLVGRDQILSELADASFSIAEGAYTKPIESPLGWHLIKVKKIDAGRVQTLEEVRQKLSDEIAQEKAVDSLFQLANQMEDVLGGGATLEEAANTLNLKLSKIDAVSARGTDTNAKRLANLPVAQNFLKVAFDTGENLDSPLTEAGSEGYFIIRVDKVTPPALKPLDTIKADVTKMWQVVKRTEATLNAATDALKLAEGGEDLASIAAKQSLEVKESAPFVRSKNKPDFELTPALVTNLFALKVGGFAIARGKKGHFLARLKEVNKADSNSDKEGVDAVRQELTQTIRNDLMTQLAGALRKRYPVTVNKRAVDQLF